MAGSLSAIVFLQRALTPSSLQAHVTFARIPVLTILLNTTTRLPWLLPTLESVPIIWVFFLPQLPLFKDLKSLFSSLMTYSKPFPA